MKKRWPVTGFSTIGNGNLVVDMAQSRYHGGLEKQEEQSTAVSELEPCETKAVPTNPGAVTMLIDLQKNL